MLQPTAARRTGRINEGITECVVQVRAIALVEEETRRVGLGADMSHVVHADAAIEIPLGRAGRALLGEDLNHAA